MKRKVVIVQRIIPHYRIPFYDALSVLLASEGVELKVVYGQEKQGSVPVSIDVERQWAVKITNIYFFLFGKEFVWQPVFQYLNDADLVVVEQANRLLVNYILLSFRKFSKVKFAFWGHGKNYQSENHSGFFEKWKRFYSISADWWFTYTDGGKTLVKGMGFDSSHITVVQNSIDTTALLKAKKNVSLQQAQELKAKLNIQSENVAIFCGGLYSDKKISFLIEACLMIKLKVPDFQMIFIGDGPDKCIVKEFSNNNDWAHYVGALTGNDRVIFFTISKLLLMPGLVGLAVLDSFALGVPMVTTNIPIHSPEFDYLSHNANGVVTDYNVVEYASTVAEMLGDKHLYSSLLEGCMKSKDEYTVENMAVNFSIGVFKVLSLNE